MTIQSVTINRPVVIYERLQHVAASDNHPSEETIFQCLAKAKEIKARVARGEETMISHDDLKRLMLEKCTR